MHRNEVRIYHSRRPVKTALTALGVLALVLVILAVAVFFGFRRYIVYTSDGVRMEVPWLGYPEEPIARSDGETAPEGTGDPDTPAAPEDPGAPGGEGDGQ